MESQAPAPPNLPPFVALIDIPPKSCIYPLRNSSPRTQSKFANEPKPSISPRSKMISLRSKSQKLPVRQFEEIPNSSNSDIDSVDNILNMLEKEDFLKIDWNKIFNSSGNCFVDIEETHKGKSPSEIKLFKRGNPMVFQTERHHSIYLANEMNEALKGINGRFPENVSESEVFDKNDVSFVQSQLDVFFTVLSECVKETASHSRSLALLSNFVHGQVLNICRKFIKTIQTNGQVVKEEPKIEIDPNQIDKSKDEKIEKLESQVAVLKKECEKLEESLDKQNYETFYFKSQFLQSDKKIQNLLKVNQSLRNTITESEHKNMSEKTQNTICDFDKTLASVPKDVLFIWDQVAQFARFILDGQLMKFNVEEVFPPNPTKPPVPPPNFSFTKERMKYKEEPHYSTFFNDCKKLFGDFEPLAIFQSLADKFNEFVRGIFNVYKNRALDQEKREKEFLNKIYGDLETSTNSIVDHSSWIRSLLNGEYLIIPAPKDQSYDFYAVFTSLAVSAQKMMKGTIKPRNVSTVIQESIPELEVFPFLSNLLKFSKLDIFADVVRKFVLMEYPFHAFLFWCNLWLSLKNVSPQDQKAKSQVIMQFFKNSGWSNNPNKMDLEKNYCNTISNTAVFALALYLELIDVSEKSIKLDSNDIKKEVSILYDFDTQQTNECWELMKAISVDGKKPTKREIAVFGFMNHKYPESALKNFNFESSQIFEYITNFGKAPKKPKKSKGKKEKAEKTEKSNLPPIDGPVDVPNNAPEIEADDNS